MSFKISKKRKKRNVPAENSATTKEPWPWRALLGGVAIWIIVLALLFSGRSVPYTDFIPGQKAPSTVIASIEFDCIDIPLTKLRENEAAETINPVFEINYKDLKKAERNLNKIHDKVNAYHSGNDLDAEAKLNNIKELLELIELELSPADILACYPADDHFSNHQLLLTSLRTGWDRGIISKTKHKELFQLFPNSKQISLISGIDSKEMLTQLTSLSTPELAAAAITRIIVTNSKSSALNSKAINKLILSQLKTNIDYVPQLTENRMEEARATVAPASMSVEKGEMLVEKSETVTEQTIAKLRSHHDATLSKESKRESLRTFLVNGFMLFGALIIFFGLLQINEPDMLKQAKPILIMGALCILVMLSAKGLVFISTQKLLLSLHAVPLLIPLALAPLVAAVLLGSYFAVATGIWVTFCVAIMLDNSFAMMLQGILLTVVAVLSAKGIHQRSNVIRAGVWIGITQLLLALTLGFLNQQTPESMLQQASIGFGGGLLVSILTVLLIPLFEWTFKITTDIRLLELSDMSHPLLQRMALEAPGTYHHSMMVANLAQSAAKKIGANDLLSRVCSYYHDIGKMAKSEFFIENINGENPHDELAPSMSTLVVISHVKEGVGMAQRYKLPPPIIDAIKTHHGTTIISYFYSKAVKAAKEANPDIAKEDLPNKEDFRYPGPKPTTPEMGILLLADSVEAASRTLEKPTASNIESLVNKIINDKLLDDQLSECSLTIGQLASIKESFNFNLNNMLHARIAYPDDENSDNKPTEQTKPKHKGSGESKSVAND